jgi:steroid 5-alpha reductase family enzyme
MSTDTKYVLLLLFQASLLISSVMLATWLFSLKLRNSSIVDIVWAALFSVLGFLYALLGEGLALRRALLAALVIVWSLRLAGHLALRAKKTGFVEEPRYAELRRQWGETSDFRFLCLFELQGILLVLLSLPFALTAMNTRSVISTTEALGMAVWCFGFLGELIADRQLARFREAETNGKQVLSAGLWKYSRHPNYFFEWLIWCGYFILALDSSFGWTAVYCPILMYYLLTRVTGIPMTEQQSLKTRGHAYKKYQERTNAFFPWFPKNI